MGSGNEPLSRYLVDKLFTFVMDWHHALAFGTYIIRQAIEFTNLCGNPVEAMFLDSKGNHEVRPVDISWAEMIVLEQEVRLHEWLFKRI